MAMRFLTPEEALRGLKLAESPYRPKEILELKGLIEVETACAEVLEARGMISNPEREGHRIAQMKLRLDSLYGLWAEEKIQ